MAVNEETDLAIGGEVHRAADPVQTAFPDPALGGRQKGRRDLGVIFALEEAEEPGAFVPVAVVLVVDVGAYAANDAAVLVCQEQLDIRMLVEGVLFGGEQFALQLQERRNPVALGLVEAVRQLDERVEVALAGDGYDGDAATGGRGWAGTFGLGFGVRR